MTHDGSANGKARSIISNLSANRKTCIIIHVSRGFAANHRMQFNPLNSKQGTCEGFESFDRPIVRKHPIWVKIGDVLPLVTLKFDGLPWKTIGNLYYATSSSMHHFVAIGEFKLKLQSGNAKFGSKSMIFFSRVILQFDLWPWKTIGHLFYATSSIIL